MSFEVQNPGVLSLLQDSGRMGMHRLGLANGGPVDGLAYHYCNRLLANRPGATVVEVSMGGLELLSHTDTWLCCTGAPVSLTINDRERSLWTVHRINSGDRIAVGFAGSGCRAYLGVAEGFTVTPAFGSTATVVRESIGGLDGGPLKRGDELPCPAVQQRRCLQLPVSRRPAYQQHVTLRLVPGFQIGRFDRTEQRRFFGAPWTVSEHCDRMAYRLEGPVVHCDDSSLRSEGICFGAVQIPPDGQPIIMLNDRQTIGGYPKIGAVLSVDAWRLAQLNRGATVHFAAITPGTAAKALAASRRFEQSHPLTEVDQ